MKVDIPKQYLDIFRDNPQIKAIMVDVGANSGAEITRDFHYKKQGMDINLTPIEPGSTTSYHYIEEKPGLRNGWRLEWLDHNQ
jgi:hypothetical protein